MSNREEDALILPSIVVLLPSSGDSANRQTGFLFVVRETRSRTALSGVTMLRQPIRWADNSLTTGSIAGGGSGLRRVVEKLEENCVGAASGGLQLFRAIGLSNMPSQHV